MPLLRQSNTRDDQPIPFFRWTFPALILAFVVGGANGRIEAVEAADADVVIYGATPGGVACAVRSAREGLSVVLVSYNDRIGGMLTSGLGVWDTLYEGYRAPLYNELRESIFDHYRATHGPDSAAYRDALPGKSGHNNGTFEAHVAETLITALVNREPNITVLFNHYPVAVEARDGSLQSVTLQAMDGSSRTTVRGSHFADCSYEGDLMAVAGVSHRIGRESRDEYNERHAGVIYMRPDTKRRAPESRESRIFDRLNIRHFGSDQSIIEPDSTQEGDANVQAFNMRYYVTDDPANQIELTPSPEYDPAYLQTLEFGFPPNEVKPNRKRGLNRPQLPGLQQTYVEGDWTTRQWVASEHIRVTRDLVYYLTRDPTAPAERRQAAVGWGLARDEFVDNNHNPYEIYVREARRLVGPYVLTENDLSLQPDYDRARLQPDSIGIVEWYMDAHACTDRRSPRGGLQEGKMMLHKETFVGQLPYRCIVTREVDNLVVPVCLSATHVAWGAVRLEPTWMQLGESAAYAILQARREKVALPEINTEALLRTLAAKRSLICFFNDFYVDDRSSWIPAVQYFGTKGFFEEYDAHPREPVSLATLTAWVDSAARLRTGGHDAEALARQLTAAEESPPAHYGDFARLLAQADLPSNESIRNREPTAVLHRAEACEHLWRVVERQPNP